VTKRRALRLEKEDGGGPPKVGPKGKLTESKPGEAVKRIAGKRTRGKV